MQQSRITLTLHGAYAGKTIVLNRRQFVDGVLTGIGDPVELVNLQKYYTTSYNCSCAIESIQSKPEPEPVQTPNEPITAIREQEVAHSEEVRTEEVESPTERQRAIAEAIEGIDGKDWISGPVDHPKVTDVATLLDDPTVTEEEIVEVLERWYVTETPECKEPKDDKE